MNNLQRLLKLRGLTIQQISKEIGQGYHITQKVVKQTRYKRSDGSYGVYSSRSVEDGVARMLGLTHEQAWGVTSDRILRRMIRQEIKEQARSAERDMRKQWLPNDRIPNKRPCGNG